MSTHEQQLDPLPWATPSESLSVPDKFAPDTVDLGIQTLSPTKTKTPDQTIYIIRKWLIALLTTEIPPKFTTEDKFVAAAWAMDILLAGLLTAAIAGTDTGEQIRDIASTTELYIKAGQILVEDALGIPQEPPTPLDNVTSSKY